MFGLDIEQAFGLEFKVFEHPFCPPGAPGDDDPAPKEPSTWRSPA